MGLFDGQLANIVEWEEFRDDIIFWKWQNREIKKGSRLIIRQGQDAIFLYNGRIEGIFREEGSYDIESDIVPFLSTLKGFKFGFNSGIRAEVLFINTKEFTIKWGTKNAITLPAPGLPGGMPIRAFGIFTCRVDDYLNLIDRIAGVKQLYSINEVKDRVIAMLDPLLMKWISQEGKDLFNLQANSIEIGQGICVDLDMELRKIGIAVTNFKIQNVSYPEAVQKMAEKAASHSMIGDLNRYQTISAVDAMANPSGRGGNVAADMVNLQMGMTMGQQMAQQMNQNQQQNSQPNQANQNSGSPEQPVPMPAGGMNFCPNCGTKAAGANFCPSCGTKLK